MKQSDAIRIEFLCHARKANGVFNDGKPDVAQPQQVSRNINALARLALVASALAMLDACSKTEEDTAATTANPARQAQAAQSSIASAQAQVPHEHRESPGAADSAGTPGGPNAVAPELAPRPAGAVSADAPPTNVGSPAGAGPMVQMFGHPPATAAPSGLPAAKDAPHIYHMGADTFFIDQASAIGLTSEQQVKLTALKENAAAASATAQRKIDQGEQELWALSSSEAPDIAKIEAKVAEIARITGQRRIAFIRAVGEAVGVLSSVQRKAVSSQGDAPQAPGGMGMGDPNKKPGGMGPSGGMPPEGMGMGKMPPGMPPRPSGGMPPEGMGMGKMPPGMPPSGSSAPADTAMGAPGAPAGMGHM